MAGQLLAKSSKDVPSPGSKNPSHPSETPPPSSASTKVRTKQSSTKKQGELPQPSKSLVLQRKSKGSQAKVVEPTKTEKRKREDESSVAHKKTKVVVSKGRIFSNHHPFFLTNKELGFFGSSSCFSSCLSNPRGGGYGPDDGCCSI